MQPPVWSPASFCYPSTSWRRCPPRLGPRAQRHHPDGPGPTSSRPPRCRMPAARPVPRIARPTICRYLCLLEADPVFILGPFCTGGDTGVSFSEKRTENPGRGCSHQSWWIRLYMSQYFEDPGGSSKAHTLQGTCGGLQRGQALESSLAIQVCAPKWLPHQPMCHLRFGAQADQD